MIRQWFLGTAACLVLAAPAWAINKCTGADGKVSFQDAPCAGSGKGEKVEVRLSSSGIGTAAPAAAAPAAATPASGASAAAPAAGAASTPAAPAAATPPAARKEGAFGETWRRKTDLEQRLVREARGALQAHQQRCAADQRDRAARRTQARTGTAVATSEQAIASEMQAAAAACELRSRELQANVDALEKELRELSKK
ncbi:hypothetical protein PMI14_03927 [Acidovorax sp. CF316]|uniref:DUF4124 domain-containing protein n=1 Tax=Acidovorax sp. CF316 TaxID=1144317 RepID=UPI00026BBF84|nr:DUF4124 domain-containing protein [Acidovorax sp. CF316]EJE51418.1 hypothetical protein PMI14_03927 [Acidovorax sp. CF316]